MSTGEGDPAGGQGAWPSAGPLKLVSPYDLDARYSENRGKGWEGYKVHLSETCGEPEPDGTRQAPNLITNVATTAASVPDAAMTEPVHDMLAGAGLLPGERAVDAGYTSADLLLDSRARGITLLGSLLSGSRRRPGPAGTPPRRSPSTGTIGR